MFSTVNCQWPQLFLVRPHLSIVMNPPHLCPVSCEPGLWLFYSVHRKTPSDREADVPGSVAETMAPKNRQSVKKKSPFSCPTCFISITQPYISSLRRGQQSGLHSIIINASKHDGTRHMNTAVPYVVAAVSSPRCQYKTWRVIIPNNKTGNDCPKKSIGQDGSHVAEKVSLKDKKNFNNHRHSDSDQNWRWRGRSISCWQEDISQQERTNNQCFSYNSGDTTLPFSSCSQRGRWWVGGEYWRKLLGQRSPESQTTNRIMLMFRNK